MTGKTVYANSSCIAVVEVTRTASIRSRTANNSASTHKVITNACLKLRNILYFFKLFSVDQCQLPKVEGPCRGDFRQWYYDKNSDRCFQFRYGGCQGNTNRFNDRQSCEVRCVRNVVTTAASPLTFTQKRLSDACLVPLDPGPCLQTVRSTELNIFNDNNN